jgi:HIV Tat-specific factor 1
MLDEYNLRGNTLHAEKAKFELKGDFDPSKKKRRLTAAQKKRFFERQQK